MKRVLAPRWTLLVAASLAVVSLEGTNAALVPAPQACGTSVPGGLVGPGTWDLAGSPYCVTGNILVTQLKIDPGVQVLVDGPYSIQVITTIEALGTQAQPILFAAKNPAVPWKGIKFQNAPCGSKLSWCEIRESDDSGIELIDSVVGIEDCNIHDNVHANGSGGGISASLARGDLVLSGCTIAQNDSRVHGGGVEAVLGIGTLRLEDCRVSDNNANYTSAHGTYYGGGVHVQGDSVISNTWLTDNIVTGNAGFNTFQTGRGGGLYTTGGDCEIRRSVVTGNTATAICTDSFCNPQGYGGGVYIEAGSLTMTNVIVGCNVVSGPAGFAGTGLFVNSATAHVENCTIARNHSTYGIHNNGTLTLLNTILFENHRTSTMPDIFSWQLVTGASGTTSATYSDIQHNTNPSNPQPISGTGNMDVNPAFSGFGCAMPDFESGDLRLAPGSPCVDRGNPGAQYNDRGPAAQGTARNDMGAHGGPNALACLARAEQRNGNLVNPSVFANGTLPRLGTSWTTTMNCSSLAGPGVAFIVGKSRSTTGPTIMNGEILVDPCSLHLLTVSKPHNANTVQFSLNVPNDLALCGLTASWQGVCFGPPKAFLSNAIDIVLGL